VQIAETILGYSADVNKADNVTNEIDVVYYKAAGSYGLNNVVFLVNSLRVFNLDAVHNLNFSP